MSELKRCPFCGKTLIADGVKFFVHPVVGCLLDGIPIKNDAESTKRWNTRKQMQNIVERLEKEGQKMSEAKSMIKYGKASPSSHRYYKAISVKKAIEIIKEEGEKTNE